jgi:hypothetical protein
VAKNFGEVKDKIIIDATNAAFQTKARQEHGVQTTKKIRFCHIDRNLSLLQNTFALSDMSIKPKYMFLRSSP